MFRVAVIARNQVELIITAAGEPLIEHVCVQPGAPPTLQGQFRIGGDCPDAHAREDQGEEEQRLRQHPAAIALVERIKHDAVPDVQPVLQAEMHQCNGDHGDRQNPGRPPTAFAPETQSRFPKTCEEVLSGLLVVILNHHSSFFLP